MTSDLVRRFMAVVVVALAVPVMAYAQEAVLSGTVTDSTGAVLPGVTVGRARGIGNSFEGGDRSARQCTGFPCASASIRSRPSCRVSPPSREAAVQAPGGTDGRRQHADGSRDRDRSRDGHRPIAAARDHHVEPGRQRRSEAGAGAPGERTQLDGALAAGAGEPDEPQCHRRRGANAAAGQKQRRGARVPAQYRRPAGVGGHRGRRPAEVQRRIRSPNFSSSRTGSTRRWAGRPACR